MKRGFPTVVVCSLIIFPLLTDKTLPAQACTPYLPDGGLFVTQSVMFTPVPKSPPAQPARVGLYSIAMNSANQVVVIQGNTTSHDAEIQVPPGDVAYYFFYGYNNRFLVLDFHTDPSSNPQNITYQQVIVDLTAWNGTTPQLGHFLTQVSKASSFQLHVYPSPAYTTNSSDTGNGLAVFIWYGMGNEVDNAGIYRSDTGEQVCFSQQYTANVQAEAKVTPMTFQILDGGTVVQECNLPRGSLHIAGPDIPFGSIVADTTISRNYTFKNVGNDCLSASSVSSSAHFRPDPQPPFAAFSLAPGASKGVPIQFNPGGAFGSFTEMLTITRTPASGDGVLTASGTSLPPAHLTVTKKLLPSSDPGRFNLMVNTTPAIMVSSIGDKGSTGSIGVNPGSYQITETPMPGTNLSGYVTSIDCGSGPSSGPSATVAIADGDDKICLVTNLGPPQLHLTKALKPASDPGRFDLAMDGTAVATSVGNLGGSGSLTLAVGNHTVSEAGAGGTNLADYSKSIDCGNGTASGPSASVTVNAGDDKVCTFTNLGRPALIVEKLWFPTTANLLFNILVDGTVETARPIGHGGTTGPIVLAPGTHTVTEAAVSPTRVRYRQLFLGNCDPMGKVSLLQGDEKMCIIVNTGKTTALPRCFAKCALKYASCFSSQNPSPRTRGTCSRDFDSCYKSPLCVTSP